MLAFMVDVAESDCLRFLFFVPNSQVCEEGYLLFFLFCASRL